MPLNRFKLSGFVAANFTSPTCFAEPSPKVRFGLWDLLHLSVLIRYFFGSGINASVADGLFLSLTDFPVFD